MSRAFGSATLAGLLCLWRCRCLRLTSERPHCIEERFSDDAPVAKKRLRVGGLSGRALVVLVKLTSKVKGSGGAREPRRHSKEEVRPHAILIMSTNWPGNPVPGRSFTKAPLRPDRGDEREERGLLSRVPLKAHATERLHGLEIGLLLQERGDGLPEILAGLGDRCRVLDAPPHRRRARRRVPSRPV